MYYYIQYHRTHRRVPNDLLHMQIVNHIQYKLDVDGYVASWEILRTYLEEIYKSITHYDHKDPHRNTPSRPLHIPLHAKHSHPDFVPNSYYHMYCDHIHILDYYSFPDTFVV